MGENQVGGTPVEDLAWAAVEELLGAGQILGCVAREIFALWKELAQKAVSVLVGAALPRASWIGEEQTLVEVLSENVVASHLRPLIPCQGALSDLGQRGQHVPERGGERLGAMTAGKMVQAPAWLVRSTRVPIAERLCFPTIRSPSQSPKRVRVSTIGGRRWINTAGATERGVRSVGLRRRLRSGRPVRSLAVNLLPV